jgi:hypothetical protein
MRRLCATIVAAAFALLAVACGQQEEVGFGGAPPTTAPPTTTTPPTTAPESAGTNPVPPSQIDPMNPVPPKGTQPVPAAKVDASALPEGYPRVAWTSDGGKAVGAYGVASGGCVEVRGELAEQNPQRVVLRLVEHTTSDGPCTMEIRYVPVGVSLAEPLGDRTVVLQRTATR